MTPPRSLPLVALVLAVAVVVAHARVIAGGKTWDDIRYHAQVAPPRLAAATAVQSGALPQWWDGTGLGVPLLAEPSHGAMYPPLWVAATPRLLDLVLLAHLLWAALGVAVWARRRTPPATTGVGDASALVVGILVATTGILASAAIRGALPALAHLPWIGVCAASLGGATEVHARRRAALALGGLLALVGLAGELAVLVDAIVIAIAVGGRRRAWLELGLAVIAGLAVSAVQWIPALLQVGDGAGTVVHGLPLARIVELVVPAQIAPLAGDAAWAPSIFVGAPLLALAAVRSPSRRLLGVIGLLVVLTLVAGRGGWPGWVGAPELHLAALVLVLAPHAAAGLDALIAAERRALLALAVAGGCSVVALGALGALRARHPDAAHAIDRALIDGGLGVICIAAVLGLAWRLPGKATPLVLALLVLPGFGALPQVAPVTTRDTLDEPEWAKVREDVPPPVRVFRPVVMRDLDVAETLDDAISTLAGASAWRWGIGGARSEDPARPAVHDRVWLAAAREGFTLLDRFGIALAILPTTMTMSGELPALGTRGRWSLVLLPVAPPAAVLRGWLWNVDPENALALLFAPAGSPPLPRGTVVLAGAGNSQADRGPPLACTIQHWTAGDIDLVCTPPTDGYAVVSSTPSPGWSVTVDGHDADWLTADLLRRAVHIDAGMHHVYWSYATPGLRAGGILAALGVLLLAGLGIAGRVSRDRTPDRASRGTS